MRTITILLAILLATSLLRAGATTLVVSAPGYPSDTEQAQETMDAFASGVASAAGLGLKAVYHPILEDGIARMRADDAGVAVLPLPLYLRYREELDLRPVLHAVQDGAERQTWSLVARRGAVASPESLEGWKLLGLPGYAPRFVRNVALAQWGELPAGVEIAFTSNLLSDLRRATKGEPVALLLDRAQGDGLARLPFAKELEVVARSAELPGTLLCRVGTRLDDDSADRLLAALLELQASPEGEELLRSLRLRRFETVDTEELRRLERAFEGL